MLAREYCDYPDNGKVLSYLGKGTPPRQPQLD